MGVALQPELENQQLIQLAGMIPGTPLVTVQQAPHRIHLNDVAQTGVGRFERIVEQLAERPLAAHPQAHGQTKPLFLLAPDLLRQNRHHRLFEERTFLRSMQFVMRR